VFDTQIGDDGYGGTSRREFGKYLAFFTEDAWKLKITDLSLYKGYGGPPSFVAFKSTGAASVRPTFSVEVDDVSL
jgi:hypothetical protein